VVATTDTRSSHHDVNIQKTCNVANHLPRKAHELPDHPAVVVTQSRDATGKAIYKTLTFAELESLSNRYANGLRTAGFERGDRVLMMVKPGVEFVGLAFALFKLGVVPVMIDPGMGMKRMLDCVRQVDLQGFIGIPLAQVVRLLKRRAFAGVKHIVTVGRRWMWGGYCLSRLAVKASPIFTPIATRDTEVAAILFTSGSTGPAKGVVYEHGMFDAQVRMIQQSYGIEPGEVDLPAFPLFALFSTAMGMTCVIPDMDPSKPATVNPAYIVEAIHDHKVTNTFGSPAIWRRVADHCAKHKITLPSLRRILIAGAPVSSQVIRTMRGALTDGADIHTPYGATESLPVASISGSEVVDETGLKTMRGAGTCVGKPLPGVEVRMIRVTDDAIDTWSDDVMVPQGTRGELVVRGPMVTKSYFTQPKATASAKITDGDSFWHRMGDVGYVDESGRLWFCGRKSQRIETKTGALYADQCEAVFNQHPEVVKSALVGVGARGQQSPVLVVEPMSDCFPTGSRVASFSKELRALGEDCDLTRDITSFMFHRALPVDTRHNVKIGRETLTAWAEACGS